MNKLFHIRGFDIVGISAATVEACAAFEYEGFQVSFSTIGILRGGCQNTVCIWSGDNYTTLVKECDTVQEAINYCITLNTINRF